MELLIADVGDDVTMEEVRSRLAELIDELKRAGAFAEARWFRAEAAGLGHVTEVRRTVNRLVTRLARFRTHPGEIPETPAMLIVACRLEDACVAVLKAGFVPAARPTFLSRIRQVGRIVGTAALLAFVFISLAVVYVEHGHLLSLHASSFAGPLKLRRGESGKFRLRAAEPPRMPAAVRSVGFEAVGGCKGDQVVDGFVCSEAGARHWEGQRLPTMELKSDQRAYGLVFALATPEYVAGRGEVDVHVATSKDTPPGRYLLSLSARYRGYGPAQSCWSWFERLGMCELEAETDRSDPQRAVPQLVIEVAETEAPVPAAMVDPEPREMDAVDMAALMARVEALEIVILENERLLSKGDFEGARSRIEQLVMLLGAVETDGAVLEDNSRLLQLHRQVQTQQQRLQHFNESLFEALFAQLYGDPHRRVDERRVVAQLAKRFAVSRDYVRLVQLEYAERIADSVASAESAVRDVLLARCGMVPTDTWSAITMLLQQHMAQRGESHVHLTQCLTPRLTEATCWQVVCDYESANVQPGGTEARSRRQSRFSFAKGKGRLVSDGARLGTSPALGSSDPFVN